MPKAYTVGHERNYDRGIVDHGRGFMKAGRQDGYLGGFVLRTVREAYRLIGEFGKRGEWAVYELDADWGRDTVPSKDGWWHDLVNDSVITRKV